MLMNSADAALLINLIGFTVGVALYGLIAVMVVRHRLARRLQSVERLLLTTSGLGLLWNVIQLYLYIKQDFGHGYTSVYMNAVSFSALGFLPSVVVHSAQSDEEGPRWLTIAAYGLSTIAAFLHLYSAATASTVPSAFALQAETVGAVGLAAGLLLFNFRQTLEKKSIWASALLVFAVASLHFSGSQPEGGSWLIELIAHQASLPLALTILYQNYRFAFADLFLKRAVSLILLALTSFGLYTLVAAPLLSLHDSHERYDPQAVGFVLALWIATALIYPSLHNLANWMVDRVLLHRADYTILRSELAAEIEGLDSANVLLDTICERLATVLTARESCWRSVQTEPDGPGLAAVRFAPDVAHILIPTAESTYFEIVLGDFYGGRRLLSDEIATLEAIARAAARRIDVIRVANERYRQQFREQEFAKLATEAQLLALRSQVNPHFLFNALTTIGYLIKADPDKAFDTLLRLTRLLRSVLSSTGEFCTLGEEMGLIGSYLEIEQARFEEKLTVEINVPDDLNSLKVPALILQPLVENAVKHGISENRNGGTVRITAAVMPENGDRILTLGVWDSGPGTLKTKKPREAGVGLRNVEKRLASYYGEKGHLVFSPKPGGGTSVEVRFNIKDE